MPTRKYDSKMTKASPVGNGKVCSWQKEASWQKEKFAVGKTKSKEIQIPTSEKNIPNGIFFKNQPPTPESRRDDMSVVGMKFR